MLNRNNGTMHQLSICIRTESILTPICIQMHFQSADVVHPLLALIVQHGNLLAEDLSPNGHIWSQFDHTGFWLKYTQQFCISNLKNEMPIKTMCWIVHCALIIILSIISLFFSHKKCAKFPLSKVMEIQVEKNICIFTYILCIW